MILKLLVFYRSTRPSIVINNKQYALVNKFYSITFQRRDDDHIHLIAGPVGRFPTLFRDPTKIISM